GLPEVRDLRIQLGLLGCGGLLVACLESGNIQGDLRVVRRVVADGHNRALEQVTDIRGIERPPRLTLGCRSVGELYPNLDAEGPHVGVVSKGSDDHTLRLPAFRVEL